MNSWPSVSLRGKYFPVLPFAPLVPFTDSLPRAGQNSAEVRVVPAAVPFRRRHPQLHAPGRDEKTHKKSRAQSLPKVWLSVSSGCHFGLGRFWLEESKGDLTFGEPRKPWRTRVSAWILRMLVSCNVRKLSLANLHLPRF